MTNDFLAGLWADRYLIAGLVGAGLSLLAFYPYIRDILRGTTKPDRACWLIWAVLASISGASNLYEGAGPSLWFVGAQVAGTLMVFALSIPFGSGHVMSRGNLITLSVAGLGLVSWALMETAVYALALSIGISALGGLRTIWKSYVTPQSETGSAWWLLLLSAAVGVASVGVMDPLLLAYPVYLFALYVCIVAATTLGRRAQAERQAEQAIALRRLHEPPVSARPAHPPVLARRRAGRLAA